MRSRAKQIAPEKWGKEASANKYPWSLFDGEMEFLFQERFA